MCYEFGDGLFYFMASPVVTFDLLYFFLSVKEKNIITLVHLERQASIKSFYHEHYSKYSKSYLPNQG